jgi:hypothetical protein
MDLDPLNLIVADDGVVRFIDVDDSFRGPAPLAMAAFAGRARVEIPSAYLDEWGPGVTGVEWDHFIVAARAVAAWLGWRRVLRNLERGELFADERTLQQIRERLARRFYRR